MNSFELLKIEYDGIYGTIKSYTKDSTIINYLSKLQQGINNLDYNIVKYSLEKIVQWYDDNIIKITNNYYVNNLDSHIKTKDFLKEINANLKPEDFSNNNEDNAIATKSKKVIFISHSSNDEKYGNLISDLIIGLGVPNDKLIYTTHPLHKIPLDKNIYEYLRENINSKIFMIILWSNKYLESPACLNEMGAAWVVQSDYTNIYVPTFDFGNPKYHECAIDTRKMGAVLNGNQHCKASLIELKNKILSFFSIEDNEQNSTHLIDNIIKKLTEETNNGQA